MFLLLFGVFIVLMYGSEFDWYGLLFIFGFDIILGGYLFRRILS